MVCAADKIHNLRTMIAAYKERGESLWDKFNAPGNKKLWFYEEGLKVLRKAGLDDRIVNQYQNELERMKSCLSED
jgi:(p)ppGpp synthase/HD superfamily hydrolase